MWQIKEVENDLPHRTKRAVDLATEKGASSWLNKREFEDAIHLSYDWMTFHRFASVAMSLTSTMTWSTGVAGFIIQRHNEVRDLEAEMLNMVCYDVEVEPVLQEITGEMLPRGVNKAPDARLDIHARGFWDRRSSAFFDLRVCHPNIESHRYLSP